MTQAAENKKLMQALFAGLAQGQPQPFLDALADDFCWIAQGRNSWAGRYEGKRAVLEQLFAPLRARIQSGLKTEAFRFIAEADSVVVLARGNNRTIEGEAYCNEYCMVCRLRDGKLLELIEYMDTELVTTVLGERVSA